MLACWHSVAVSVIDSNTDSHNYDYKLTLNVCRCLSSCKLYYSWRKAEKWKRRCVLCTAHLFSGKGRWRRIQEKSLTYDIKPSLVNPFLSTSIIVKRQTARLIQMEFTVHQEKIYLFIWEKKNYLKFMSHWHLKSPETNIHTCPCVWPPIMLHLFIHLADPFLQSDLQERFNSCK